jgi:hypothetical protein
MDSGERSGEAVPAGRDFFGLSGGLSGNQIKIIGVVMMVVDHLYQMFHANGAPPWFKWIGRPVAPLFIFMCAEGFYHTRDRKKYLLRLLLGYEFMNVVSTILSAALPNENVILIFSIFGSLFFTALYLLFIDLFRKGIRERQPLQSALAVLLMLAPVVYGLGTTVFLLGGGAEAAPPPPWAVFLFLKLIPNVFTVEGNLVWVLLGVLFYLLRKNCLLQVLPLAVFGVLFFLQGSIEWLMVFAALPILFYNGGRGRGNKYFFYIFYPAHIYLLYLIAYFLQ